MIKTNNALKVLATSAILLIPNTAEAVTVSAPKVSFEESVKPDIITQRIENFNDITEMAEQIVAKKEAEERLQKRIEEKKLENERILLEQQRNNFIYLVETKSIVRLDLTTASGLTAEDVDKILSGTGLQGLGKAFVEAESKYGVNTYYLMAHAAWESEWGKSQLAQNKNNLFGFTAYDATPGESAAHFNTKEECIDIVAKYVKEHYLNVNGKYHNGSHLDGMNVRYATDKNWANGIGSIMKDFVNDFKEINSI